MHTVDTSAEELMRSWAGPERVRTPKVARPRIRTHSRRLEWEDQGGLADCHFGDDGEVSLSHYRKTGEVVLDRDPELSRYVSLPSLPPGIYDNIPEEWRPLARGILERFNEPVRVPAYVPTEAARQILAAVYHLRHHHRAALRQDGEQQVVFPPAAWDLAKSIDRLMRDFREETLARAGHRTLAHGVFPIDRHHPEKGWRVQIWDTSKEKKNSVGEVVIGGKLHIAYKKTEEEAWACLAEWFLRNRGIDARKYLCYHPESAIAHIAGLMRQAAQNVHEFRNSSRVRDEDDRD